MNGSESYRIEDEPQPGGLAHLAVNPIWPFFAIMFGGTWLSWPWFIVNAIAVGSPTKKKEISIALGGFAISFLAVATLWNLADNRVISEGSIPYALLAILVWKLGVTYWLHTIQGRTFELFLYFGGTVRSGVPVLLFSFLLGSKLLDNLPVFLRVWLV